MTSRHQASAHTAQRTANGRAARHPISLALALLLATAAGTVQAQSSSIAGTANTNATLTGALTQTLQGISRDGAQVAAVGAVRGATVTGQLTTNATVSGAVTQSAAGTGSASNGQLVSVGGASGSLTAATLTTQGTLGVAVTQQRISGSGSGAPGGQSLDVASVSGVSGGNVTTGGRLAAGSGVGVNQTNSASGAQKIAVGAVDDSALQTATTDGFVLGSLGQFNTAAARGNDQTLGVARIRGSQATTVRAEATVFGQVQQQQALQGSSGGQVVEIGSVLSVDAAGTLRTNARLEGNLTQSATGSRSGVSSQTVGLGRIQGGSARQASTNVLVRGSINQQQTELAEQALSVGEVVGGSGTAATRADVFGDLTQTAAAGRGGSGIDGQRIDIASAKNNRGDVATQAFVLANVQQGGGSVGGISQRVDLGSVQDAGAGTARTSATVTGNISQQGSGALTGSQAVLVGSVGR